MSRAGARGRGSRRLNPAFQQRAAATTTGVPEAILKQARQSGQLNLSNRSLESVPSTVWRINLDPPTGGDVSFGDGGDDRWWDQTVLLKLILAANQITELSEEIEHLPALILLDVHDNKLISLPTAIGRLENLTRLILSHNNLSTLESAVTSLANLNQLKIDHNKLTSLPDDIGQLLHLEELDVSHNKLTLLPPSIGDLRALRTFTASHNQLTTVPGSLGQLRELKTLTMEHNKLTELPPFLDASHLEVVELQYNQLTTIPLIMPGSTILQLHLGSNQVSTLSSKSLESLTAIVYLSLRDNKIKEVPEDIVKLETLERLELSNNSISILPYAIGNMPNLKSLMLDGNTLKGLRRDIVNRGTSEVLKYLRSRLQPDTPPEHPGHVTSKHTPTKIHSSGRATPPITSEPAGLGLSPEKKRFDLSKKSLSEFPLEICDHHQITDLNLSGNKLTSVPPQIGQLTALTVLDVRNNLLTRLPSELEHCARLVDVVISFNSFTEIPSVLYKLPKLENIIASDNRIGTIDVVGLSQIPGLGCLDIQNNSIAHVPPQLGTLSTLKHLQLGGNPFRIPRASVLAQGTQALLDYLRDRIPT